MLGLFLIFCIIQIIIQIISVIKLKKSKKSKYFNLFIGINIASFISTIYAFYVFRKNILGLSDAIYCLLVCGFSFITNIVLLIIGLIVKKITKDNKIRINKNSFFIGIFILLLNIIIIFILPTIVNNISLKLDEKKVINYLNNKYGNSNYKVISIYKEYSHYGMWDKYLSGYYYKIKSDYMKDTFIIKVDNNYIEADYFLPVYFSQKYNLNYNLEYHDWNNSLEYDFTDFNNYIKDLIKNKMLTLNKEVDPSVIYNDYIHSYSNIDGVKYNSNYYIISSDNGKIPTIEELIRSLINYKKIHLINIKMNFFIKQY